jgi:hypothetical protein
MRRTRIYGLDRRTPGSDVTAPEPEVVQQGTGLSSSARGHLRSLHSRDLARPASSGGGVTFLLVLAIIAVIVLAALAATGNL